MKYNVILYSFISNSTYLLVITNKKWMSFCFNALLNENTLIVPKSTRNLLLEGGVCLSWALIDFQNFQICSVVRFDLIGPFFLPPPPTSHEFHFFSVTSGFTRLSMKTKYVCRGLISLYVNFHNNPIKWATNLHVKIRRWGGGRKKSPNCLKYKNKEKY